MAEDAPSLELKRKFLHHLRNKRTQFNDEEKALRSEFGLTLVYPE